MGFFSNLFGVKKSESENKALPANPSPKATAASMVGYDETLVLKLKNDHQELFRLYGELSGAASRGALETIPSLLADMKLAFQTHIMLENVKFYVYLQQHLSGDADLSAFLSDVRHEMDGIARVLVKFVNTYAPAGALTREKLDIFKSELANIGAVLTKRVEMEESRLYTLYMPNY